MSGFDTAMVRATYSTIARDYVTTYGEGLADLPINVRTLAAVADRTRADRRGPVVDLACGPAQVAAHLRALGCTVVGLDPAAGMLAVARERNPGLPLVGGELAGLPLRDGSCAGVVAFYVLHHIERHALPAALSELRRVVAPGGVLLLATHEGQGLFTAKGVDGAEVSGTLYDAPELVAALGRAGFTADDVDHRRNLPHEREGLRAYVTATAT